MNSLTSPLIYSRETSCVIMSLSCCFCRLHVDQPRKRKNFYGRSCDTARLVICSISSVALGFAELKDPNAWLCTNCDKLFKDLQAAEMKVNKLRQQITERLHWIQAANDEIPSKRSRIDCTTQEHEESTPSRDQSVGLIQDNSFITESESSVDSERITGPIVPSRRQLKSPSTIIPQTPPSPSVEQSPPIKKINQKIV